MRHRYALDGAWDFYFDEAEDRTVHDLATVPWQTTHVPEPWQARFVELRDRSGVGWYRRHLPRPAAWPERSEAAILHFGAVDYYAEVWFNGHHLGDHEGGYLPFQFDVAPLLQPDNEILVRVVDPSDNQRKYPAFPFPEIPHGKQSWYGQTSGLWQPVWLERRSTCHVRRLRLTPDLRGEKLLVEARLAQPAGSSTAITFHVTDSNGKALTERTANIPGGATSYAAEIPLQAPRPWSPGSPALYNVAATLTDGGTTVDRLEDRCGFRTIETRNGCFYLNDERLYLRGALDQDYYLDSICTTPSTALLEEQMEAAQEMGLNLLRHHIKVADPRYHETADRLGMLVWAEFPNFAYLSPRAARRARETIAGMIKRDWNHPSIIIWTIINEDWGTNLVENEQHRAWLREMYQWVKELDPHRLVVDNSPNRLSFHVESDIADYHYYQAHPDGKGKWDDFIARYAAREPFFYSPHGDAVQTGREPLVVSEFGVWGLPDIDVLLEGLEEEPYWFEYGLGFYDGVAYPHGVKDRFRRWHFAAHFGNWRNFVEATQWRQYYALKYQIETIRRRSEIQGYVITELTDVHWEVNGLLDMRRNPRVFTDALAELNRDTAVIAWPEQRAYRAGETVQVEVTITHQQGDDLPDTTLHWALESGQNGEVALDSLPTGAQHTLALSFEAPGHDGPVAEKLTVALRDPRNRIIARNHVPLNCLAPRTLPVTDRPVWTGDDTARRHLAALGYRLTDSLQDADVAVVDRLDADVATFGRAGGRVVLLADGPDVIGPYFPRVDIFTPAMRTRRREGTPWSGYWVTSFSWLRRDGPFAAIPGTLFLDQCFEHVVPDYVLEGFGPNEFEERVYAGLFVGWVNNMVTLVGERKYGQGHVVMTTFRLFNHPPGADPIATALLDGVIELALQS